jgi:hypothetical protein
MQSESSIKGSIFSRAVEDINKLIADGETTRESVDARIGSAGAELLDRRIQPAGWYPVKVYGAMLEVLRDVAGGGSDDYLYRRGAESAEALIEKGIYQQLDYLSRTEVGSTEDPAERFRAFGRDLNLLVSLHGVMMNFGHQTARVDPDQPDRYVIELAEAADCPDTLCCTTTGFMNRMAREHGDGELWTWARPRRDFVVFRMLRPV